MKTALNILLFAICCILAFPVQGQEVKGSKNTSRGKKAAQNEVQSDFDLTYKLGCNLKLDKARVLFEKGLLEKIPFLLKDCADDNALSKNTRLEILKLLAETHLFLNEETIAENYYENILKIDPFYQVQPQINHPELVYLSRKFQTKAPFSFGVGIGGVRAIVQSKKQFLNDSLVASQKDKFTGKLDLSISAFLTYRPGKGNVELSLELQHTRIRYDYEGDMIPVFNPDDKSTSRLIFSEKDRIWQVPLTVKYRFSTSGNLKPYVFVGAGLTFTTQARFENLKRTLFENEQHSQPGFSTGIDISNSDAVPLRKLVNVNGVLGTGIQYHRQRFYFFADLRYNKMLTNVVNTENRFDNPYLTNELWHVDNDLSFNSVGMTFGLGYSIFKSVRVKD